MIYFTSDFHFGHCREFIYRPRGFETIEDMNNTILKNCQEILTNDDDLYILGDIALGGPKGLIIGCDYLEQIPGNLHLIRGNHDTDMRWSAYSTLPNVVEQADALYLRYEKYHFYLSHFPTMTGNLEKEALTQMTLNLYGHTHQKTNFYNDIPYMYHVGVDSHNCKPIPIEQIVKEMKNKIFECIEQL